MPLHQQHLGTFANTLIKPQVITTFWGDAIVFFTLANVYDYTAYYSCVVHTGEVYYTGVVDTADYYYTGVFDTGEELLRRCR